MRGFSRCKRAAAGCGLAWVASASIAAAPVDLRLIEAVKNADVDAVRTLLKERPPKIDVNAAPGDGATALHWAAHRDDLTIADLLIRAGARPNAANDLGATPLHLACTNRSAAMVERLLAAGANANAALANGESVLMTCARAGGGAGTLKGGRHIRFQGVPLANLHLTLLDLLGAHCEKIGDSTGRIDPAVFLAS